MICISTFLTCSLYLLYLLLNSCGGNDAFWRHSMLVKQSSSFSRKHWTLSVDLCPSNSPVDYRICGLVQECVYNVHTPICDTSHCDQRLEAASQWHIGKHMTKHYRQRCWSLEKAVTCNHEGKMTPLWTSAKLKPALFRAKTLHKWLFQSHQQSTKENALFHIISVAAI